jgi:hypothetical protein
LPSSAAARGIGKLHDLFDQVFGARQLVAERTAGHLHRAEELRHAEFHQHGERRPAEHDHHGGDVVVHAELAVQQDRPDHEAERAEQADDRGEVHAVGLLEK